MKSLRQLLLGIIIGGLMCLLFSVLLGCSRQGYGCKGNSKIITRVR